MTSLIQVTRFASKIENVVGKNQKHQMYHAVCIKRIVDLVGRVNRHLTSKKMTFSAYFFDVTCN